MAPIPRMEYSARMGEEIRSGAFWRDVFAELLAAFMLAASVLFMSYTFRDPTLPVMGLGLGVAFAWAAVGYALEDFGHAHMSSAVTMAFLVRAEITLLRALVYWIMQAAAAIGAAFFVWTITQKDMSDNSVILGPFEVVLLQATEDAADAWWRWMVIEVFVTFLLCVAALASLDVGRKGYIVLQSLPVGMAAGLGTILAFRISGACMNPTLNLGRMVLHMVMQDGNLDEWQYHWVFWAGPMAGAVLAAIVYWVLDSAASPDMAVYNNSTMTYNARPARTNSKERLGQPADAVVWPAF